MDPARRHHQPRTGARATDAAWDARRVETTLETVAALALLRLASWSIVDLAEPDGSVRRATIVHPDPELQAIARELKDGWPPRRDDPLGASIVARTGRSELIPRVEERFLMSVARTDENLRRLRALGMASVMTVPTTARGRILDQRRRRRVYVHTLDRTGA